jgi:hypothetical protein
MRVRRVPHVQELLSFDDWEKKKIIGESVRTSSAGSDPEGFGLWVGRFVRRSLCAGCGCACAIIHSIFNSFLSFLVAQGHDGKEKHCHKKKEEQLVFYGAGYCAGKA